MGHSVKIGGLSLIQVPLRYLETKENWGPHGVVRTINLNPGAAGEDWTPPGSKCPGFILTD